MKNERRFFAQEVRAIGSEKSRKVGGYAAMFNSVADIGPFSEVIRPGAFKRTLAEGANVFCLFNHNADLVLGRSTAGTLRLWEDEVGLQFECDLPNTTVANDLYESVKRKDIDQCSFGFMCGADGEAWSVLPDGTKLRSLIAVTLLDVSAVTYPAYDDTSVAARSRNILPDDLEARMASATRAAASHLGVVPFSSYDARSERSYNSADEANGIISWADGEDEDRTTDSPVKNKVKAASGFLFVKNAGEKRSDYIGPHHTILDGSIAHSQVGTLRCAMSLATGKLDIQTNPA